jgi:Carboxypeptidase regulatory-like domain
MRSRPLAFLILAILLAAAPARAQVRITGQIVGTVHDPSDAVVQKAAIEVTDIGTGITAKTTSNDQGGFVFPALQPGQYRLLVTASGFEPALIDNITVETGRASNVEVKFAVATVGEEVKVVARSQVIETTSTTVSTTVNSYQIAKLPLNSRNVLDFALLTPGTATSSGTRFSTFNGLPGAAINLTLDGINNN